MYDRNQIPKRDRLNLLAKSIQNDQVRRVILEGLADGRWHSIHDLGRRMRNLKKNLGIVRIGIILSDIQTEIGQEVLEKNEAGEIAEWRVNPAYIEVIQSLLRREL